MSEFGNMLQKATKKLEKSEEKTFNAKKSKRCDRGERFEPPENTELYPPIMNRKSPKDPMQYLMLGFCKGTGKIPYHTFIVKYPSKNGDKYYRAKTQEIKDAIASCGKRKAVLKAIVSANNTHPIPFTYRNISGHLPPLPKDEYEKKTQNTRKRGRETSDSTTNTPTAAPPTKRPKSNSKSVSDSDDELEQGFAKNYPNARKSVTFSEPENSESDSGGCSETDSHSSDLDKNTKDWISNTKIVLKISHIIKFMKQIGPLNVDMLLYCMKKGGISYKDSITSKVLYEILEVGIHNTFAENTPGMVDELLQIQNRKGKIPDAVVLASRELFCQALEDVTYLFLFEQDSTPTFDHNVLDPQEKEIYERLALQEPSVKPYCDFIKNSNNLSRRLVVRAVLQSIDDFTQTNRVLVPYRFLLLLVYFYGLTAGFSTITHTVIVTHFVKYFQSKDNMVTKGDLKREGY